MADLATEVVEGVINSQDEPQEVGEVEAIEEAPKREREMITLDTPVPEMPAVRIPQPDELQHENKLAAIDQKIARLRGNIDDTYNQMREIRETGMSKMNSESSQSFITDTRNSKKLLAEERRALVDELRALKRDFYDMIEEQKKIRNKVKVQDYDKIDSTILNLRRRLETETHSFSEEKQMVSELAELEKSKPFALQHRDRAVLIDQNKKRQTEIQEVLDGNESRRKEIDASVAERKQIAEQINAEVPNLIASKEDCKAEIEALRAQKKEIIQAFRTSRREYNEQQREIKQIKFIKDIQKKIRDRIKREAEWKARQDAIAEEEALEEETEPYATEISYCRMAISYLERYLPKEATPDAQPAEENKVNEEIQKTLETNKLVPMLSKKQQEEQALQSWGGGKGKGKKQKRERVKKQASANTLNHPIDSLNHFNYVKITPPKTVDQVPAVITLLEEKIVYFENLPKPEEPEESKEEDYLFEEEEEVQEDKNPGHFPDMLQSQAKSGFGVFPEEKLDRLPKKQEGSDTRGGRGRRGYRGSRR